MTNRKFIDELGESVVDSTFLQAKLREILQRCHSLISGKINKNHRKVKKGQNELKSAGGQVVQNLSTTYRLWPITAVRFWKA
jgi:hypothetical protein